MLVVRAPPSAIAAPEGRGKEQKVGAENVPYLLPDPVVSFGSHGATEFRDRPAGGRLDQHHLVFCGNRDDLPTPTCEDYVGIF